MPYLLLSQDRKNFQLMPTVTDLFLSWKSRGKNVTVMLLQVVL